MCNIAKGGLKLLSQAVTANTSGTHNNRKKRLPTTALQDENSHGWANNLQGIHMFFSNDINLSIREYFARNNK